ncbi:hypothetical protein HYX19_02160 [Candidatus Woesearchaeota archaeon]|nr:hypothetical protein [Candidatus Woesearchaeota archaeon]
MKNKLIGGLVGILIGFGVNSQAKEINKDGFEIPDKNKSKLTDSIKDVHDKGEIIINGYRGELNFNEVLTNNKPVIYIIFLNKEDESKADIIADEDCSGKFKTRYNLEEAFSKFGGYLENVPTCYFDKK